MIYKRKPDADPAYEDFWEVKDDMCRPIRKDFSVSNWRKVILLMESYEPYLDVTIEELKLIEML